MSDGGKFWGKYRGTVINNIDPDQRGRLLVEVPDVLSLIPSSWAEACVPLAGPTGPPMGVYIVPTIGAGVWIEFEHGDPNKPIWSGCRWGSSSDVPSQAQEGLPVSPSIILQTIGQNSIVICDLPGPTFGITLTCGATSIAITAEGVTILAPKLEVTAAQIKLTGITDINDGALKVV